MESREIKESRVIREKENSSSNTSSLKKNKNKNNKVDSIPSRMNFIKELLGGNVLQPIVDYNNLDMTTEQFTNPNNCHNIDSDNNTRYSRTNANNTNNTNNTSNTRNILDKQIHDFYEVINKIGGKLRYIKSGTSGHTFKGIIDTTTNNASTTTNLETLNYAVKVVAYPQKEKYGNIHDLSRPENAEIMMIRLLSYFVIKKQTPHIVLPIATFDTSIKPFVTLIKDNVVDNQNKKYLEFVEKYNENYYHKHVSILISEWANRGDLLDFIRKYYKEFTSTHWKVIFFQIISVLAVIQSKFPSFRHNDLKANNILIHKLKQRGNTYSYTVNKMKYTVPNIGYQIKIWDFDFACIPGIVDNSKVSSKWTEDINVTPVQNRYYDIHYFFNTLIKKGFFPQILEDASIDIGLKQFINRIVPEKLQNESKYVSKRGRILVNKEYLLPDDILKKDIYFEEFRNDNCKGKSSSNNNIINTDIDKVLYDDYKKNLLKK